MLIDKCCLATDDMLHLTFTATCLKKERMTTIDKLVMETEWIEKGSRNDRINDRGNPSET